MDDDIKALYICHYCIDYKTSQRKDMIKHFERKKKCICNNPTLSYEEAKELTLYKKYYFYFDYSQLLRDNFIKIINFYNEKNNFIYNNYYDAIYIKQQLHNKIENNQVENNQVENNQIKEKIIDEDDEFNIHYFNFEKMK